MGRISSFTGVSKYMNETKSLLCLLLLLCTLHSGCAVLGSKEAAAGCQVADVATTHYALHHNPNAVEQNGIPVPALDVIKLALAAYIKYGIKEEEWNESWIGLRIFITAVGCGAAINNIKVGNQKP